MDTELRDDVILLRTFRAEDVDAVYEAVVESFAELTVWMPWCHKDYQKEDTAAYVLSRDEARQNETEYSFAIIELETNAFLGVLGINSINRVNKFANLGYWVRTSRTGRGIALRATRLGARFVLEQLDLHRVEIMASVDNLPSQRVAEKAGALREGILRKRLWLHDAAHDVVLFSLVAEDLNRQENKDG